MHSDANDYYRDVDILPTIEIEMITPINSFYSIRFVFPLVIDTAQW